MIKVEIFNESSFRMLEAKMNNFFEENSMIERADIIKMEFNRDGSPVCKLIYEV